MCFSTALGRFELTAEVFQFVCVEIGDRPQREARLTPVPNIESLHRLHRGAAFIAASLRDKQIDDVGAPPIGQSRNRLAVKVIEAPPMRPNPSAVRSATGGATSRRPLNQGLTVC